MIYLDLYNIILICALKIRITRALFWGSCKRTWLELFRARDENNNQSNMTSKSGSGGYFTNLLFLRINPIII